MLDVFYYLVFQLGNRDSVMKDNDFNTPEDNDIEENCDVDTAADKFFDVPGPVSLEKPHEKRRRIELVLERKRLRDELGGFDEAQWAQDFDND